MPDGQQVPEMAGASPKRETATEDRKGLHPTAIAASIFISYASKDRAAAHTICDALEHRGFDCWIADRDIGPGENFQVSIVHAIRSAKVMILVFSANAANSEEIKKEVVLAGQSRLVVIPVRVEDVTPDEAFAYEMATRQWVDLFDDWEHSIQRLVHQLEAVAHIKSDFKIAAGTPVAEQGVSPHKAPPSPSFPEPAAGSSLPSKSAPPLPKKLDWRLIAAPGGTAAVIAAVLALWLSLGHSNSLALVSAPVSAPIPFKCSFVSGSACYYVIYYSDGRRSRYFTIPNGATDYISDVSPDDFYCVGVVQPPGDPGECKDSPYPRHMIHPRQVGHGDGFN
jgi:hypothetical protein